MIDYLLIFLLDASTSYNTELYITFVIPTEFDTRYISIMFHLAPVSHFLLI
jgi:hypothetical protein